MGYYIHRLMDGRKSGWLLPIIPKRLFYSPGSLHDFYPHTLTIRHIHLSVKCLRARASMRASVRAKFCSHTDFLPYLFNPLRKNSLPSSSFIPHFFQKPVILPQYPHRLYAFPSLRARGELRFPSLTFICFPLTFVRFSRRFRPFLLKVSSDSHLSSKGKAFPLSCRCEIPTIFIYLCNIHNNS